MLAVSHWRSGRLTVHSGVTELRLERMVHGGACIARVQGGRLALVHGGIPGELVRTELTTVAGVPQGRVLELLEPSPDRQEPTVHPGLDLDHVTYTRQLDLKRSIVVDALQRALPRDSELPEVLPAVASPQEWSYRNTVQPVVVRGRLGYRLPGSHDVQLLERDPVASEAIATAWSTLQRIGVGKGIRELVFRGNDDGEVLVALVAAASARNYLEYAHELVKAGFSGVSHAQYDPRGRFRSGSRRLTGSRQVRQRFGRFELSMAVDGFAQPNAAAAGVLYGRLQELAGTGTRAHELYAGSGAISFHLADSFQQVYAFEIDSGSVRRGRSDAERLGIDNVSFLAGDVRRLEFGEGADLVTVDPPRSGLNKDVRDLITSSDAGRLQYVSCDAATWARDVAAFSSQGWRLAYVEPFDFYPHTHHVELLSQLVR